MSASRPSDSLLSRFFPLLMGLLLLAGGVSVPSAHAQSDPILINFQPDGDPVPTGYTADIGAAYGLQPNDETYGWLKTADDQPVDASSATRDRGYFSDQRLDTFNHLQRGDCCETGFTDEIYWQYDLPNGTYEVTVAFGDAPNNSGEYDSQHQVSIEGTLAPDTPFQPTSSQETLQVTKTVEVTDGVLTITPTTDAVNAKLNYADIAPTSDGTDGDALLVHWPFDEGSGSTATDASGNGRDGTISGASYTTGQIGSALSFPGGTTDLVEDADAETYLNGLTEVSVALWIKSNQANVDQGILGTLDSPDGHDYYLTLRYDQSGFTGNQPQVIKAGMRGGPVNEDGSGSPTNAQQFESSANQQTTDWQHIALVWTDGQDPQLYIDGQLDTPSDRDGMSPVTGALEAVETLKIGQSTYGGNNWSGLIDDVRVYGRALSASEISALANPTANTAPTIDAISDQSVEEGQTLNVSVSATDAESDPITLTASNLPGFASFTDNGDGTGTLTATPQSGDAGSYSVTITASDDTDSSSETFALDVTAPGTDPALYRMNVAGGDYTDANGNQWTAENTSYLSGTSQTSSNTSGFDSGDPIAGTTDDDLYITRRYGTDFTYDFPVSGSGPYEVELHFAEIFHGVSNSNGTGARIFDVEAEGNLVLDDLDLNAEAGPATALVKTISGISVNDDDLTLRFFLDANGMDNAIVQGIVVRPSDGPAQPQITSTIPADGATGVDVSTQVTAYVSLPNTGQGVDASTVNASTVELYPTGNPGAQVTANYNTTGGADAFTLQPTAPLDPFTEYTYVADGVQDQSGAAFPAYSMTFTTGADDPGPGTSVEFTKMASGASSGKYATVTMGPDGKLYGLVHDGTIKRWTIASDGTLQNEETITSLTDAEGGQRLSIGLTFDPDATASTLVAWVSHTTFGFGGEPDWQGKITQLSGPDLGTVQDYVVNLPRSAKDHVTNSLVFGPDGALYVNQGSNSAMGAADDTWSLRPERMLTAAVLRVDVDDLASAGNLPLNVKTADGGTYDPYASNAPVKLFATGIRNMYDLVWHSNGNLYVPTNGSAAGGNTPASVDGTVRPDGTPYDPSWQDVPAESDVPTQPDLLFRVPAPTPGTGGDIVSGDGQWSWAYQYHGHPNPSRGEYVMNGGNPTSAADYLQVDAYPEGIDPDPDYAGAAFNFGKSKSPNGVIEYQSTAFNGALQGEILVVRYSGGDDIIVLTPNGPDGDIGDSETGIPGFTGFNNPLDLTENPATGDIYVSEYGGSEITLLKPTVPPADVPAIAAAPEEGILSGFVASARPDYTLDVQVSNTGGATLDVSSVSITGTDAGAFSVAPSSLSLAPGTSQPVTVTFTPSSTGPKEAALTLTSNDPDDGTLSVPLYGLASQDFEGGNEPPLAQIVQTLGYNIDVGFTSLASDGTSFPIGDEVMIDHFEKAGSGNVTITPVARYSPPFAVPFGWYAPDGSGTPTTNVVGTLSDEGTDANPHHQMLFPPLDGNGTTFDPAELSFDPGSGSFGFFAESPNHTGYTDDAINSPTNSGSKHRTRIYPLNDRTGAPLPNSYLIGFEEAHNHDHNDYVFVVTNVQPATPSDGVLLASDTDVGFGAVSPGATASATVTLSNDGSTDIGLTDISVSGDAAFSVTTSPLPGTVPAGGQTDLAMEFAPTATGSFTGTLTVAHDGVDSPLTVNLSGTSVDPSDAIARINVGGAAYTDAAGNSWSADDTGLFTGQTNFNGSDIFDVQGTPDDEIFATRRWGTDFTYEIDVPTAGTYDVNLYFAEPHWGRPSGVPTGGEGDRLFDVTLEGTLVLDNYDLYADGGGWGIAITKTYTDVSVSDGSLTIEFDVVPGMDNAIISGIEILAPDATGGPETVVASLNPDWNLFGLPLTVDDPSATAVFSALSLQAGPFGYDESYDTVTQLAEGEAYWVKVDQSTTLEVTGTPFETATLDLEEGWNLVAGPSCSVPLSSATGDTGILIDGTLYSYGPGGYVDETALAQGQGYWVKAGASGQITLDCSAQTAGAALASAPGPTAKSRATGSAASGARLIVTDQAGHRQTLLLGGPEAKAGAYAMPPVPPRGAFDARFAGDTRLMSGSEATLLLQGTEGPVRLRLEADGSTRYQVESNGGTGALWLRSGEEMVLAEAGPVRIRSEASLPQTIAVTAPYPNPVRAAATLRLDLPETADVAVRVYDVLGRSVLQVPRQQMAAGSGRELALEASRLSAGLYFYRVQVRTENGRTHRSTGRFTVVR